MSKSGASKSGNSGGQSNGQGKSGSRAGSPGRGRAPNGFYGGNWPSTVTNVGSGSGRGSATPSK
jgi:hypothetical protein